MVDQYGKFCNVGDMALKLDGAELDGKWGAIGMADFWPWVKVYLLTIGADTELGDYFHEWCCGSW